jgi:hypothetical protein
VSSDLVKIRGELRAAAQDCLRRKAAGQRGRVELPIQIDNDPGPVHPCNAGTLFDISWSVDEAGRIYLQLFIDGIPFWSART